MPICTNLAKFKCIKLSRFEKTFFIRLLRIFSSFLMDFQNFEIMNNKFGRFMNLGKQILELLQHSCCCYQIEPCNCMAVIAPAADMFPEFGGG
jgi:hypothetical protein